MLFVRMLTIILQRMSRSIQTKEACPPIITAASLDTSDPNVHHWTHTALQASRHQQQFVPAYQSGKSKKNKPRRCKRKPQKPTSNHGYEGLLSLMQDMLRSMANMDMTRKPSPRFKQEWVKKDETIHPMRGNERTEQEKVFMPRIPFLILRHQV
jgi:hypothetical protein